MIPRQEQMDLLTKWVRVTNPRLESSWEGELIGFADHPTLILTSGDGSQISLPQSFTIEVIDAPPKSESSGDDTASKPRYTLAEAQQILNQRKCAGRGHVIEVVCSGLSTEPVRLVCGRCGDSWAVQPKETS